MYFDCCDDDDEPSHVRQCCVVAPLARASEWASGQHQLFSFDEDEQMRAIEWEQMEQVK